MRFQGKVAIVTGASRGIGKAVALALAQEGAQVVVAARTEEAGRIPGTIHQTAREVEALGGKVLAVRTDVSDEASVDEMVRQTLEAFGRIDILVNNAAVAFYSTVAEMPVRRWDLVTRVNLRGPFLCSRAVLAQMMEQRSGSIVNLSSVAADPQGLTYVGIAYCATKAAVERFTTALAEEVRQYNIAVNAVKPRGIVLSEGMQFWNPHADWSQWDKPDDFIVKSILFLAAQDAASLTGQVFVDEELCRHHNL